MYLSSIIYFFIPSYILLPCTYYTHPFEEDALYDSVFSLIHACSLSALFSPPFVFRAASGIVRWRKIQACSCCLSNLVVLHKQYRIKRLYMK